MHISEAEPFLTAKHDLQLPLGHRVFHNKSDPDVIEYQSNEEPCLFLDPETKFCTIYDRRPTICRTYPVQWQIKRRKTSYYLDCSCPLSHRLPLHTFMSWIEGLPQPELIDKIGELNFNSRERRYLNLTVINEQADPLALVQDMRLRAE